MQPDIFTKELSALDNISEVLLGASKRDVDY